MVMRKRGPSRAVVLLVASLVTGCTTGDGDAPFTAAAAETASTRPPSTTTTTAPPTTTTTVALPPPAPIAWAPCGGGFQCATTDVPVDYENPGGATLSISLIKRPASAPGERIGTLIMNPGGPAGSAVTRVRRGFPVRDEVGASPEGRRGGKEW